MAFSEIKWITFDAGGTLLFPNPSVGHIYAEILGRHGHEREPAALEDAFLRAWRPDVHKCVPVITPQSEKDRWRGVVARTFADLMHALDFDALFEDLWIAFRRAERWRLPPGAEETLAELRSRGYRLAMLSNWDERLRPLLRELAIDTYFDEIFVSCELGCEKPDPRIFAAVEARLGVAGTEILHIGDSHHHDILGATARGWPAIHAFCEDSHAQKCLSVSSLTDLLKLLPGRAELRLNP